MEYKTILVSGITKTDLKGDKGDAGAQGRSILVSTESPAVAGDTTGVTKKSVNGTAVVGDLILCADSKVYPVTVVGDDHYAVDTAKGVSIKGATGKGAEYNIYQVEINAGEDKVAAITKAVAGKTLNKGDIAIVKETLLADGEAEGDDSKKLYTAFVYDGANWAAMDGNYDADNVYFSKNLVFTSAFGNFAPDSSGSVTIGTADKKLSLQDLLEQAFAEEKDPKVNQPWVNIKLNEAGAKEVGTSITPSYQVSFGSGSYQYGPNTGVTATFAVSDTDKHTATADHGNFAIEGGNYQFTVGDDTNYKVSVVATHTAGAAPKTNLGNEKPDLAIKAGTKSAESSSVTGYRNSFWGGVNSKEGAPTSAVIRGLSGKKNGYISAGNEGDAAESVGDMRVIIAVPAPRTITSIKDVNGLNAETFSAFKAIQVDVEGANGYTAKSYNVYYKDNAEACNKANKWHFTVA